MRRYLAGTRRARLRGLPTVSGGYQRRFQGLEADAVYKHTLEIARVWESRYEEGYKDGRG